MSVDSNESSWQLTLVPLGATIQRAIHSLEKSSMQIVLAYSDDKILVGTLTDGDIRRAFLRGLTLDSRIDEVIHRNPLVAPPEIGREFILQLMHANKIHQLPVVDGNGKIIGLHIWESIIAPAVIENQMVIMAGGQGIRMRPYTENCPKPMLEVGGKPMLEHIIERSKADGFRNFTIALNYLGHMIEDHFGDGSNWEVKISYLREEEPLGTAGALSMLQKSFDKPFLVTNGDVMTDIHYCEMLDFHIHHNAMATMAVRQYEIQNQFGVVKTKGLEIEGFEEKPIYRSHINSGIYVLNPDVLHLLESNKRCDMPTLFDRIKENGGRTIVYPMHEPWLDVGIPEDLAGARSKIK
jgi:dTDP-glucose pyrophosphorylase